MAESRRQELIKVNTLKDLFTECRDQIEKTLPKAFQGEADRLIQMTIIGFVTSKSRDKLAMCKPVTYARAFLEAAAFGFALDGKNCYPIPYGDEVTCMFDWKALVTCARRAASIKDGRFQTVYANDHFEWWEEDGKRSYKFRLADDEDNRGDLRGAFGVVILPDGNYRFEWMSRKELGKVRASSKSPNSPAWQNWEERMYGKAVLKRCLQGLDLDPTIKRLIDLDNQEFDVDKIIDATPAAGRIASYDDLAARLEGSIAEPAAIEHQPESIEDQIPDFGLSEAELAEPVVVPPAISNRPAAPAQASQSPASRPTQRPSIANHGRGNG